MDGINRIVNSLKRRGFKGSIKRFVDGPEPGQTDLIGFWSFIIDGKHTPFDYEDYLKNKDESPVLNWIIPEMGKGSGGHINIFRFVSYLERNGIHNRIYIDRKITFANDELLRSFTRENFQLLDQNVELFSDINDMKFAHGVVATSWQTAYFANRFDNCISKFYFIQDYEPYFYPLGSEYEFARNTYKFGFRGITAGSWLKDICIKDFGMKADSFSFSYDKDLYKPMEKQNPGKKIFFYARPVTPRRDFELGLLALYLLCQKMPEVEVIFAGWDIGIYKIPFKHKNLGILELSQLGELYADCDMCLILSNTNLSLLPLEVMGSGSVAVCSKGPNSEWLVNSENSILVDFEPQQIADTMEWYLKHPEALSEIRKKGIEFAQSTNWNKEEEIVRQAVLKGIEEDEASIDNRR